MADQNPGIPPDAVALSDRQKEWNSGEREYHKAFYEYLRYFSTLGTATIVAIGALVGKIIDAPTSKGLAVASVIALLVSVVASTIVYTAMITHFPGRGVKREESDRQIQRIAMMATWLSFLIGIGCLAVFVIKNV